METKEEISLHVLPDKKIQVLITTVYLSNGLELTRKNFRFCLDVEDYATARLYLNDHWVNVLTSIWE